MLARVRFLMFVFIATTVIPSIASGQAAAEPRPTSFAGPRRDVTATAFRQLAQGEATTFDVTQRRSRQGMGTPVALMVVGGAAVVLGALIGDDVGTVFMIGGAVALLIGLYQYLQ